MGKTLFKEKACTKIVRIVRTSGEPKEKFFHQHLGYIYFFLLEVLPGKIRRNPVHNLRDAFPGYHQTIHFLSILTDSLC